MIGILMTVEVTCEWVYYGGLGINDRLYCWWNSSCGTICRYSVGVKLRISREVWLYINSNKIGIDLLSSCCTTVTVCNEIRYRISGDVAVIN